MISDLCERDDHETCFENEMDGCACICHPDPADSLAGVSRPTTEQPSTGGARQAQDPAAIAVAPVPPRRAARAIVPGGPGPGSAPHPGPGGTTPLPAPNPPTPGGGRSPVPVTAAGSPQAGGTAAVRGPATNPAGGTPASSQATSVPPGRSRTFTVALPAGLKMLNLNQRLHWAEERRRAREIKQAAWAIALHDKLPRLERVSVVAEYQPPDRRHRDGDNIAKAAKHALDGIVAAGRLPGDDRRYVTGTYCTIGEPYPKGRLVLHLTEIAATESGAV